MLYKLFYPLSETHILFNLIRYISFRSIAAFATAFLIGVLTAPWFIKKLRALKFGQEIRDDGPQSHLSKKGTPTMGGVFIIVSAIISFALWARFNYYVFVVGLSVLLFGAVGFVDDYLKVKEKNSKGVSAKLKIVLQVSVSLIIITLLYFNPERNQDIKKYSVMIKDKQSNVIKSFDLPVSGLGEHLWEGRNENDKQVRHGEYRLELMVEDSAGNTVETRVTNFYWPGDYSVMRIGLSMPTNSSESFSATNLISNQSALSGSVAEDQQEAIPDSLTREWELRFYAMDLSFVSKIEGKTELPHNPDLFLSFYFPYYSKELFKWPLLLGALFFLITLVAFSNATNLSDGLDGLASGMGIILFIPFGVFAYVMGNALTASYLLFPFIHGVGELAVVLAAMVGGFTAFLWYNIHPARVFMGDTGSLAMGGTIATSAIILKQELLLLVAGAMFVFEALSVVLQVFWFKRTGKRLFKMSPIHHHFELSGWAETQVVVRFWILSVLFALLAVAALKIR